MAKDEVKNQHYVPQAYLRHFANSKEQIWVFDKSNGQEFQTNVRNVASERRFYDNDDLGSITGDRQFIEKQLGNLEGHYETLSQALVRDLSRGRFRSISPKYRHFLATYMVVQMLRTKESRIQHEHMAKTILAIQKKAYRDRGLEIPSDTELLDGTTPKEMAQDVQHRTLLDGDHIREMAMILYRHIWVIQEAFGDEEFITSDHPFVKRGHITGTWRSMSGIASEGIEILFPLSPKYLLTLVERRHFATMARLDGLRMPLVCHDNMIYNNQFQVKQSNRFVFSRNKDFDFVRMMIAEEPIHGDPNRNRLKTNHDSELEADAAKTKAQQDVP